MEYRLEDTASYLIYRVGRLLRFRAGQFFKQQGLDISPEQWALLLQIADKGNPSMSDLVDTVVSDHPNVTRLVAGLHRMGYVVRMKNPEDRRSHLISMTSKGDLLIQTVLPNLMEAKEKYYEGLDQKDVAQLISGLQAVLGNLEK